MNWVAPIKDEETLKQYKEQLKKIDEKYYILFEIGVGTGMQLQEILRLTVGDVRNQDSIRSRIGTKDVRREFVIPDELKENINKFVEGRKDEEYLILGFANRDIPLSREQAYRVLRAAGMELGLNTIGAQTMRKTFAWRYYKRTGDIYYIQNLLNHSTPSITYRYIGEKPTINASFDNSTAEENVRARLNICMNNAGRNRMEGIKDTMNYLEDEINNPMNSDAFYGKLENLLDLVEDLLNQFKAEM